MSDAVEITDADLPLVLQAPREDKLALFYIERNLAGLMILYEDPDLSADERDAVAGAIAKYVLAEIEKVDGIRAYIRHCEVMAAAAKEESLRQKARQTAWEARIERLKNCCLTAMEASGKKRIEGKTGTLIRKSNGGKQALSITDESLVPPEFKRYTVTLKESEYRQVAWMLPKAKEEIDLAAVRAKLEAGEPVAGGMLLPRGEHVEVK